jgi:broad specificity phosphatase PhoE
VPVVLLIRHAQASFGAADYDERHAGEAGPPLSSREFQVVLDGALQRWIDAGGRSGCARTWPMFLAGIDAALADLARDLESGQTAMVFSSSGSIAAAAASLIGQPDRAFVALNRVSVNTAITKVIVGREGRTLVSYNEHGHLDAAGGALLTYR